MINQNKCRKFVKQMRKRFPEPQKKNKKSFKKDLTKQKESLKFVKQNRKSPKEFFEKLIIRSECLMMRPVWLILSNKLIKILAVYGH